MVPEILVWKLNLENDQYHKTRITFKKIPVNLNEVSKLLPGGAYTTFRTFNHNQVLSLNAHFSRLKETAFLVKKEIAINSESLRVALREAVSEFENGDMRVRIVVDLEVEPGIVYFAIEKLNTPSIQDYQQGVKVITRKMHRNNPKAKLTEFITAASAARSGIKDIEEILMISENGQILEGLSSNFFGVCNGKVFTADEGVLSGITRSAVIRCAEKANIPLSYKLISISDIRELEEAFITSTSRSILPVNQIDHVVIGNGKPGSITLTLMKQLQELICEEAEVI